MAEMIKITAAKVIIQENGIIRLESNGYLIGRLVDDISFEDVKKMEGDK